VNISRVVARAAAVAALVGLCTIAVAAAPASADIHHPTVTFVTPVCTSGQDVAVNGTINWKVGPVGSLTLNWGDGSSGPASFPDSHVYAGSGTFTITATVSNLHGTGTATKTVTVGPGTATCAYTISPQPIAEEGTLGAGQSSPVVVTVRNPAGKAIASHEPVWLSFAPAPGGGTATACCTPSGTSVPLATTPNVFVTGGGTEPAGQALVTYTLPASPPSSGTDVVTAAALPGATAPASVTTSYTYSPSPVPLTPPSSIASDCSTDVSVPLGQWFRNLPPNSTVIPPSGACYQVDEGISLNFPNTLTVDGGTYENHATMPASTGGGGTQRGSPVWNVLGGSALTLENMTISGVNPGGYNPKMAFAAGIVLQGTTNATIEHITITNTYGDGITLNPLRSGSDHKGSGIVSPTINATISNVDITGPGRMGIAFVSVRGATPTSNGASVSSVTIDNVGLDTFDVEADQGSEGSQNVTINGCTASTTGPGDFFADGGSSSGKQTGNITVENCTMQAAQAGTAIWVARPTTGTVNRGPYLFDSDTFDCGTSIKVTCVIVSGGGVTVSNSTLSFPAGTPPFENVYTATSGTVLAFTNDTVTGYGQVGTFDSTSTVTVTGGTWTPGS
jgi:hypothetical protein